MSTATLTDPQALVQQAVRKVTTIATLPEVTAKIIATVEDPKSSAAQLHKIVAHDPALVTRILKVVNSAFYGLPGQIGSVDRAIVLLGLNAVKNIAIAASLGQLFRGVKLCKGFNAKDLWTHCIAVGVCAREIAKQSNFPFPEEAFLAGMIHDVGILVSLQVWPENLPAVCTKIQESVAAGTPAYFCALEQEQNGVDHQQLGAALTELWKFPRTCQLVAGFHHRPLTLADDARLLPTLVFAADTICCQQNQGFNLTALNQKIEDANLPQLGIAQNTIDHVRTALPELVKIGSTLLG